MTSHAAPGRPFVLRDLAKAPYLRLVRRHHVDGLGVGWGASRFVPPPASLPASERFRALYAASDLTTAFAETLMRDEAVDRPDQHPLAMRELDQWDVIDLTVDEMPVVDLTGPHLLAARVATDAVRAKDQTAGRELGLEVQADPRGLAGIVFPSRLTGAENLLVFERAIGQHLTMGARGPLLQDPRFAAVLDDLRVAVI